MDPSSHLKFFQKNMEPFSMQVNFSPEALLEFDRILFTNTWQEMFGERINA